MVEKLTLYEAASSLALLIVLCLPIARRLSYELFLRSHQLLAFSVLYSLWQHTQGGTRWAQYLVIGAAAMLVGTSLLQVIDVLCRHRFFYHGLPRASVEKVGGGVRVSIAVQFPLSIHVGQYLNLYMPTYTFSFSSFLQSHPFMVTSVQHREAETTVELMIDPRHGWTSKLAQAAHVRGRASNTLYTTFFSGPHGRSFPVDDYGIVVLAASGWGVMAQLPYLQYLIRGYNTYTACTRRIHLIWQLDHISKSCNPSLHCPGLWLITAGDGAAAQELLNRALLEDTLDDGYVGDGHHIA